MAENDKPPVAENEEKPWEDEDPISWTTQTGVALSQWGKPREEHEEADEDEA